MAITSEHNGRRIASESTASMSCWVMIGSKWARGSESGALMILRIDPPEKDAIARNMQMT